MLVYNVDEYFLNGGLYIAEHARAGVGALL